MSGSSPFPVPRAGNKKKEKENSKKKYMMRLVYV
jgi:hypothetical protein